MGNSLNKLTKLETLYLGKKFNRDLKEDNSLDNLINLKQLTISVYNYNPYKEKYSKYEGYFKSKLPNLEKIIKYNIDYNGDVREETIILTPVISKPAPA